MNKIQIHWITSGESSFGQNLNLQTECTDTSETVLLISPYLFGFEALAALITLDHRWEGLNISQLFFTGGGVP